MDKEFELETILTFTTMQMCTDNFDKVYELARFVYDDEFIGAMGLDLFKDDIRKHLLRIHPDLKDVKYNAYFETSFSAWLYSQKIIYGKTLPVSKIGQGLEKDIIKTRRK